jgi:threonine/homoserine/homoserine lactone efflux protein
MAILGATDVLMEVVLYGCIGVLAGAFHARLAGTKKATVVLNYVACTVYVVLAVVIITEFLMTKPFPAA